MCVNIMKSLVEYINDSMLKHIAIELKDYDIIYEKYGEYNGCDELATYITNATYKLDNDVIDLDVSKLNIENTHFDNVSIVKIDDANLNSGYDCEHSNYNEDKHIIENVKIYVPEYLFGHKKQLHSFFEHELQHIFDDWILIVHGMKTLYDVISFNDMYERSKMFNDSNERTSVREIRLALYLLNTYEQRFFIAQLCDEIRDIKLQYVNNGKQMNSLNATLVYNMTKDLQIYQAYENISRFIIRYKNNKLFKSEINAIENEWYEMTGENESINRIMKFIENKLKKVKNKLERVIPKKIAEELYPLHHSLMMDSGVNIFDLRIR